MENSLTATEVSRLSQGIGLTLSSSPEVDAAFQHRSFCFEQGMASTAEAQRALMNSGSLLTSLLIHEFLFCNLGLTDEKILSTNYVKTHELVALQLADRFRLMDFLRLGVGAHADGTAGIPRTKLMTFWALVGAANRQLGFALLRKWLLEQLTSFDWPRLLQDNADWKSDLQEYSQRKWKTTPSYKNSGETGPDHEKVFTVQVSVDRFIDVGQGPSKKAAEVDAARKLALKMAIPLASRSNKRSAPWESTAAAVHAKLRDGRFVTPEAISKLQELLKYKFKEPATISLALPHVRFAYERGLPVQQMPAIATLGNAVIRCAIDALVTKRFAGQEGQLDNILIISHVKKTANMATLSNSLGLDKFTLTIAREDLTTRVKADIPDKLLGAIYLDSRDFDTCAATFSHWVDSSQMLHAVFDQAVRASANKASEAEIDPKSSLNHLVQILHLTIDFRMAATGPSEKRSFVCHASLLNEAGIELFTVESGEAPSGKMAEKYAARALFDQVIGLYKGIAPSPVHLGAVRETITQAIANGDLSADIFDGPTISEKTHDN